jgi:hypothetical protein
MAERGDEPQRLRRGSAPRRHRADGDDPRQHERERQIARMTPLEVAESDLAAMLEFARMCTGESVTTL